MRKLLYLGALLIGLTMQIRAASDTAAITAATESYVAANSAITKVNVEVEQIADDFARVKVTPQDANATDPAWAFMKKTNGKWTGVALGSSFTTEDYQQLGIPNALRIP